MKMKELDLYKAALSDETMEKVIGGVSSLTASEARQQRVTVNDLVQRGSNTNPISNMPFHGGNPAITSLDQNPLRQDKNLNSGKGYSTTSL